MLNKKNLTLAAAVLTALAIFAGCAPAAALSPETTLPPGEGIGFTVIRTSLTG